MQGGHHPQIPLFHKLPVLAGDADVGVHNAHGGDAPQTDQNNGGEQPQLVAQIPDARILFLRFGVAVMGAGGT